MAGKNGIHPLPTRPPLSSHQSNSVPSTPHQHARDYRSRSRSPSPHAGLNLGGHSPRSVKSEANHGPMTTLPKGRPTCKYETSAAFSRRRMQYDIGDAPLEKPKEEPKKTLDPHEENKLSGDMRELYDRLYPSDESNERRQQFVKKLEDILRKQWPDQEFKVHIFGSHANNLCTSESDVDICIQTPMKSLETMHMLAEALANNGMERVICIAAAKVPIVKIWDPVLRVAADMNVNNTLALENTRMIRNYVMLDDRVRPLGLMIKYWTKQRILNDAGIGGTLSSYAWTCMILNFLQTRNPPILPALHQLRHKEYIAQDGTESGFTDDLEALKAFGSKNKETIGELLFHFFRHYAYEFNYDTSVVSVRHGKHLTRKEKSWAGASKDGQWRLCIEEPFNITRNLGNSADSTAFRGIHLEIRRAFDLIAEGGQLKKCYEEYHFPPEEKNLFKKPVSNKPTLSFPIPIQPAGRGSRGGAHARNNRNNGRNASAYTRRSSSGASFGGRSQFSPFVQSPPLGIIGADYMTASSIEDQLFQQSQMYGFQIEQLKAKMAFQQSQIQQAAEQARAHAHSVVQGSSQSSRDASATVSPQKTPFLNGTSSPQVANHPTFYPEFLYHPRFETQPMAQQAGQDGPHTNPSSPSLSTSTPVRRTMQRSSLANDGTSIRSQSQPPRGVAPNPALMNGYAPFLTAYGIPYYAVPATMQEHPQSSVDGITGFDPLSRTASLPVKDSSPREYVGYYMPEPRRMSAKVPMQQPAQQVPQFNLPQIPQYSELAHRRNRPSQELQLSLNGQRRPSRSPSPLGQSQGHQRTFSIPLRSNNPQIKSAPLPHQKTVRMDSTQQSNPQAPEPSGLLIVNGSSYPSSTIDNRSIDSEEDFAAKESTFALTGGEDAYDGPASTGGQQQSAYESPPLNSQSSPPTFHAHPANDLSWYPPQYDGEGTQPNYTTSPMQAFPAFVDPGLPTSRSQSAEEEDAVVSPKSAQPSPWRTPPGIKPPPIDTTNVPEASKGDPTTAPLLSPVYETRTPSPTAHRRPDHMRLPSLNGIIPTVNGAILREGDVNVNGGRQVPKAIPVPPTPASKLTSIATPTTSSGQQSQNSRPPSTATSSTTGWQTTGKKKPTRHRQRSKSGVTSGSNANPTAKRGEPMPANESERKGG